jgi:hypothetical protein
MNRKLPAAAVGVLTAVWVLGVAAPSGAGTHSFDDSLSCWTNPDGTGGCSFTFLGVRNDATTDWATLGMHVTSTGPYGWFNGQKNSKSFVCVASPGPLLDQWPRAIEARQSVTVEFDASAHCTELTVLNSSTHVNF